MSNDNYDIKVYREDVLMSEIQVGGATITFQNYVDKPIYLPFGVKTSATIEDLEFFF